MMLFNSIAFMIFLPLTFSFYWMTHPKYRWIPLLIASYYFYMSWNIKYVFLILFTTGISYTAAILMEKTNSRKEKRYIGIAGIILSFTVLFFFKYFNFLSESIINCLRLFSIPARSITFKIMLPVGISFYTFQTASYIIDVYKGTIPAEKHFGKYAVFVSFFPQLVAGPIERTKNLLPEIKKHHIFSYENAVQGMKFITWGFFKKLVIADNIASYINAVYNDVTNYSGFVLVFATVLFAFQIYCDFSGYSDIAIGTAKLFDISLMTNFRSPYFSASYREFWSRWHISLSTWFRDYVYIPLGGNRVSSIRRKKNLLVTFLASGLWHGANWTFVLWGGLHGIYQIIENAMRRREIGQHKPLKVFITFCFVCFAWIFFRSNTVSDSFYIISHLFKGMTNPLQYVSNILSVPGKINLIKGIGGIVILLVFDYFSLKYDVWEKIKKCNVFMRNAIYFGLIFMILILRPSGTYEFIYFQF
jgi:D-alanyl-lipoteichoic acid acyltransferase DltB (MBOAT superfamily)